MRAGELRQRITIEEFTETQGDMGDIIEEWVEFATVWADIQPLRGREYWDAQQAQSEVTGEIHIRHRNDLSPEMRVKYDGRTFQIDSIFHPAEDREKTVLLVVEDLD